MEREDARLECFEKAVEIIAENLRTYIENDDFGCSVAEETLSSMYPVLDEKEISGLVWKASKYVSEHSCCING